MININTAAVSALAGRAIPADAVPEASRGGAVLRTEKKVSAGNTVYWQVDGIIRPNDQAAPCIEWRVLLPQEWNRRSVQLGGGANNGHIPDLCHGPVLSDYCPIDHGYVVFGDDSGHQSDDPMSAEFASNEEALMNYIRLHLIKANRVMHFVVKECYGCDAEKTYFAGGSAGGREALECASSYGKHYDGIFCASPASSFVMLRMWGAFLAKAVYDSYDAENHPFSDGFIDEPTVAAIRDEAVRMYDEWDGIKDGIVSNIFAARANREKFLEIIREKYQLTEAQLKTIDIYENGFTLDYSLPRGANRYGGCSALEGGLMDLGPDPVPREPLDTRYNVHHGDRADGIFKYFIAKDRNWKLIEHDYARPDENLRKMLEDASRTYDADHPDFDEFIAHGGKMILFSGWHDMSISPWQTVEQYRGYVRKYGQEQTDRFVKFYVMPSVGHCQGISMDYLEWLDTWCTTGQYPEGTLYGKIHKTGGEMPMAAFPGWVKYVGGDPLCGSSYEISYEKPEQPGEKEE